MSRPFLALCAVAALACGGPLAAADRNVRDFGARGDGAVFDQDAIQQAIDAAAATGGGRVTVPAGTYLVRPFRLKSGVELHLEAGATLLGSPDLADYPDVAVRHIVHPEALPRRRSASLILADEAHDVAITGEGTIDANGLHFVKAKDDPNWTGWQYERKAPMLESLPRVVFFAGCSNVTVRGVTLRNPPSGWSWWFHDCDDVLVEDSQVKADVRYPNNDGFHVNSCRNVTIRNCDLETGDDSIVVRANNRTLAGIRVCENVVVSNCTLRSWSGAIRIGWTNDGTIRNCLFRDLRIRDSSTGIAMTLPPVGPGNAYDYGREATRIENLVFEDIAMDGIYGRPILVWVGGQDPNPRCAGYAGNVFRNIRCKGLEKPLFTGRPGQTISGFAFENCTFEVLDERALPDYRRHGAAAWGRRHGEKCSWYDGMTFE